MISHLYISQNKLLTLFTRLLVCVLGIYPKLYYFLKVPSVGTADDNGLFWTGARIEQAIVHTYQTLVDKIVQDSFKSLIRKKYRAMLFALEAENVADGDNLQAILEQAIAGWDDDTTPTKLDAFSRLWKKQVDDLICFISPSTRVDQPAAVLEDAQIMFYNRSAFDKFWSAVDSVLNADSITAVQGRRKQVSGRVVDHQKRPTKRK